MAEMTPEEIAAIRAEFAVPVAMEDAKNGVAQRNPMPMQMPRQMPQAGYGTAQQTNNGIRPDGSVGVPQSGGYGGGMHMEASPMSYSSPYPVPPQHVECRVYEDGGQKFMIKNGCIYKQTWTTIENGGECRMFDVKKGKKVQPKGIVIQKYDWVPLSAINAMDAAFSSERPKAKRRVVHPVAMPQPMAVPSCTTSFDPSCDPSCGPTIDMSCDPVSDPVSDTVSDPVQDSVAVGSQIHADEPSQEDLRDELLPIKPTEEKPVVPLKKPNPTAKPVTDHSDAKPVVAKQMVRKPSVHNAGIVKKPSRQVSDKD